VVRGQVDGARLQVLSDLVVGCVPDLALARSSHWSVGRLLLIDLLLLDDLGRRVVTDGCRRGQVAARPLAQEPVVLPGG
jgi:hypothetical protein